MKTTWTLDLKSEKAQRNARAYRRELQSLQGMLEQVDGASARLNATLGRAASPAVVQRRVRAEQAVAREVRATYDAHAAGHRRVSQDARTQQRIRSAVDNAQRGNATRADRDQRRRAARDARSAQGVARLNAAAFRRDQADGRARTRQAQSEHDFRVRTANQMLASYGRQQRMEAAQGARRRTRYLTRGAGLARAGVMGGGLAALGITATTFAAAGALARMAVTAGELVFNLSHGVLQMIAFRESALTTLRAMSGGQGNPNSGQLASEQYRFAQRFAMQTPLDAQQVLELQSQVSTAGFTGAQNRDVLQAAADVGASRPNDSAAASRYVLALSQIRNAGRLRAQEMNQLSEVGVGRRDLLLELGRQNNVRRGAAESEDAYVARLGQMQESRRFTGDQGVAAAQGVVRRRLNNNGEFGDFSRGQGETLLGTISNLRGSLFTLITTIEDIENLPGIRALKTALNGVAATLSGITPNGQRLQRIISAIVDEVSLFAGLGIGDFDAQFGGVLDTAEQLMPVVRTLVTAFVDTGISEFRAQFGGIGNDFRSFLQDGETVNDVRELARGLVSLARVGVTVTRWTLTAAGMLVQLAGGIHQLWGEMGSLQQIVTVFRFFNDPLSTLFGLATGAGIADAMRGVGTQAVDGVRAGIMAQRPLLDADVRAMAQSIPTTSADALSIRSPSRVMADAVGRYIPEGIALGIDRGRGPLDRAMQDLVPMPGVSGFGPGSFGGVGGLSIENLNINVGAGATEETGRAVARGLFDELASLLEAPALSGA